MANPVPVTYNAAASPVAGGRYVWPAWRREMTPRTWRAIPATNTLADLNPKNNPALNPNYPNNPEFMGTHSAIIYAWCGAAWDDAAMSGPNDPGVQSVRRIYDYYKQHGVATEIMGASFRNVGQIMALSGCDLLTISPELLAQLATTPAQPDFAPSLTVAQARESALPAVQFDEASFRYALNEDAMATEKLAEGIRAFAADAVKLEALMHAAA